jgi:hypothetical protein
MAVRMAVSYFIVSIVMNMYFSIMAVIVVYAVVVARGIMINGL